MEDKKMGKDIIKIAAFTGSLRKDSYNKAVLRAAGELLPDNAVIDIIDLADIPFLNEDEEAKGLTPAVKDFREKLFDADALLISTPEYNFSIPPVLKNALDWASRGEDLPLYGKPAAIVSASPSRLGGARVQYHLRQVCVSLNIIALNKQEDLIAHADEKFDKEGKLTHERTRRSLSRLLEALVENTKKTKNKE